MFKPRHCCFLMLLHSHIVCGLHFIILMTCSNPKWVYTSRNVFLWMNEYSSCPLFIAHPFLTCHWKWGLDFYRRVTAAWAFSFQFRLKYFMFPRCLESKSHSVYWTDHQCSPLWQVMTQTASFLLFVSVAGRYRWCCQEAPYTIRHSVIQSLHVFFPQHAILCSPVLQFSAPSFLFDLCSEGTSHRLYIEAGVPNRCWCLITTSCLISRAQLPVPKHLLQTEEVFHLASDFLHTETHKHTQFLSEFCSEFWPSAHAACTNIHLFYICEDSITLEMVVWLGWSKYSLIETSLLVVSFFFF